MTDNPEAIPETSEQLDQLQSEDTLLDRGTDDVLDEGYSPPEHYSAAERFGNTAAEMLEGETLDQRIAQEEPEISTDYTEDVLDDGEVGAQRAGRLVDPDGGIGQDYDAELVGEDVGIDGAGASAEEAAVHIIEDPLLDS